MPEGWGGIGAGRIASVALALAPATLIPAAAQELFVEAESFSYSGTLQAGPIVDGFEGGRFRPGGTATFTHNEIKTGIKRGAFAIALLNRYDYTAEYSPDTADLYYRIENDLPVTERTYDLELDLHHIHASGLALESQHRIHQRAVLELRVAGLRAYRTLSGTAAGTVAFTADGRIEGGAEIDYLYEEDLLFDREVPAPRGWGWTSGASLLLDITEGTTARLWTDDPLSRIYWRNAPQTTATLLGGSAEIGEDGVYEPRPTIIGQNEIADAHTRYRPRHGASVRHDLPSGLSLSTDYQTFLDEHFASVEVAYHFSSGLRAGLSREFSTGALGVSLEAGNVFFRFHSDALSPHDAEYLNASFGASVSF